MDTFLKWVEVVLVTSPLAQATIAAFRQVFSAQGLPGIIVFDNGTAFTSAEYLEFLTWTGFDGC